MCGIAAAFGAGQGVGITSVNAMLSNRLSHRGPDGLGIQTCGQAIAAHARLAIVDRTGGQQPMYNEDGRVLLVCNGEIYNHRQLRRILAPAHGFRSESDSEVILHLYEDAGSDCVAALDGMFAFFVTDGEHFLVARDPFGIKPLYFGLDQTGGVWFASELKALVDRCVTFGSLPAGTFMTESQTVTRWFEPDWADRVGTTESASPDDLLPHLERAVVKRLMSDVPLGVLLSGGLDSSLIAALARRHLSRLQTFAVGVEGAPDLAAARQVAKLLGADHHERTYTVQDASRCLEEVIYHLESYDAALIRSALPCYFVSELAAGHVKVVLTGEGADELFAGYGYMGGLQDPIALHHECVRLLFGLQSMNLQRLDRMTMAHGLEGRVPFLDVAFVNWAMGLAPKLKVRNPKQLEKALLRTAAEQLLPAEIAQRPKLEFAQGSSSDVLLEEYARVRVSDKDLAGAALRFPTDTPRNKEQLLYRLIFDDLFPGEAARGTVARWRQSAAPPMTS